MLHEKGLHLATSTVFTCKVAKGESAIGLEDADALEAGNGIRFLAHLRQRHAHASARIRIVGLELQRFLQQTCHTKFDIRSDRHCQQKRDKALMNRK